MRIINLNTGRDIRSAVLVLLIFIHLIIHIVEGDISAPIWIPMILLRTPNVARIKGMMYHEQYTEDDGDDDKIF